MSAWAEIVNADGSDEWLEKCEAALLEVQTETLRRAAAKVRREIRRAETLTGSTQGRRIRVALLGEAADLIDPEHDGS